MFFSWRVAGVLACALMLAGCLTPPDFDTGETIHALTTEQSQTVRVWFMTTRCNVGEAPNADARAALLAKRCWEFAPAGNEIRASGFGIADGGSVNCGIAEVIVAGASKPPTDSKVTRFEPRPCGDLIAAVANAQGDTCRCAMIFVHGYNTTFPYALKRTGHLAVDLADQGRPNAVPILFSFGAAGRLNDYINDVEAGELAAPALHHELLMPLKGSNVQRVDIVAHSMGTRIALRAITEGDAPYVDHLIAAAPDIDPAAFLVLADRALNGSPQRLKHLTVYTSEYDTALAGSIFQHNGRDRIGHGLIADVGRTIRNADVINASNEATTGYGHSYFAESKVVLNDIKLAMAGKSLEERKIRPDPEDPTKGPTIACANGGSCPPSLYESFVKWVTRLFY